MESRQTWWPFATSSRSAILRTRPQLANIPSNATVGRLQLEVNLPPEFDSLRPGSWRLTLRIGAANAKPIEKTLLFSHTGEWRQNDVDMRRECLRVSLT